MVRIDENTKGLLYGYVHGTAGMVLPARVNPANNKLLIEIIPVVSIGTIVPSQNIPIDENTKNVGAALTNDANLNIIPLTVDEIVGFPALRIEP